MDTMFLPNQKSWTISTQLSLKRHPFLHGNLYKGTHIYTVIFKKAPISTPLSVIINSNPHASSLSGPKNYPNLQIWKKVATNFHIKTFAKKATHFYTVFQKSYPFLHSQCPKTYSFLHSQCPKTYPFLHSQCQKTYPFLHSQCQKTYPFRRSMVYTFV